MIDTDSLGERVYARLRKDVSGGSVSVYERLDFAELAQRYDVSTTPVREAAMRLFGEGLLEIHPKGGLRPIHMTQGDLTAVLELHAQLAALALRWQGIAVATGGDGGMNVRQRARLFFIDLARGTGNLELIRIVEQLEDRLERYARLDDRLLADVDREVAALRQSFSSPGKLRSLIRRYHRRRLAIVARSIALAATEADALAAGT